MAEELPDHPDYWKLSQVMLEMDGVNIPAGEERHAHFLSILTEAVDEPSITQAAISRVGTAVASSSPQTTADLRGLLVALWVDAFVVGVRFEKAGGHQ